MFIYIAMLMDVSGGFFFIESGEKKRESEAPRTGENRFFMENPKNMIF